MFKFYAQSMFRISEKLERYIGEAVNERTDDPDRMISPDEEYASSLSVTAAQLESWGLSTSAKQVERLAHLLSEYPYSYRSFEERLRGIQEVISDELSSHLFMRIQPEYRRYYEEKNLFGLQVPEKFPLAIRDIEHAGNCLAFGEGTACVYHLMRVMEVGLKALAKALGVPYAPSWESYLRQINDKISVKYKKKGIRWKRDEPFFKEIAGDLFTIKVAWRNPTMHIVRSYGVVEAEEIYKAVRSFMCRLAAKLPS